MGLKATFERSLEVPFGALGLTRASVVTGERALCRDAGGERKYGVGQVVVIGLEDATDGAGEVLDVVGLATFEVDDATQAEAGGSRVEEPAAAAVLGDLVVEAEAGDVGAVVVRRGVAGGEIARVVSVVEEAKAARGIQRVRPGVGELIFQSMAGLLVDRDQERVVVRPAGSSPLD